MLIIVMYGGLFYPCKTVRRAIEMAVESCKEVGTLIKKN